MANAGFILYSDSKSQDNVCCSYCSLELDGWEDGDVPRLYTIINKRQEHQKRKPECPFLNNRYLTGDPYEFEEEQNTVIIEKTVKRSKRNAKIDESILDEATIVLDKISSRNNMDLMDIDEIGNETVIVGKPSRSKVRKAAVKKPIFVNKTEDNEDVMDISEKNVIVEKRTRGRKALADNPDNTIIADKPKKGINAAAKTIVADEEKILDEPTVVIERSTRGKKIASKAENEIKIEAAAPKRKQRKADTNILEEDTITSNATESHRSNRGNKVAEVGESFIDESVIDDTKNLLDSSMIKEVTAPKRRGRPRKADTTLMEEDTIMPNATEISRITESGRPRRGKKVAEVEESFIDESVNDDTADLLDSSMLKPEENDQFLESVSSLNDLFKKYSKKNDFKDDTVEQVLLKIVALGKKEIMDLGDRLHEALRERAKNL